MTCERLGAPFGDEEWPGSRESTIQHVGLEGSGGSLSLWIQCLDANTSFVDLQHGLKLSKEVEQSIEQLALLSNQNAVVSEFSPIMASENAEPVIDTSGLRERNVPHRTPTTEMAKKTVQELNAEEYDSEKDFEDKRTFGRTPDGVSKFLDIMPNLCTQVKIQ